MARFGDEAIIYTEGDPDGTCPHCQRRADYWPLAVTAWVDERICLDCGRQYARVNRPFWDRGMQREAPVGALYAWSDTAVVPNLPLARAEAVRSGMVRSGGKSGTPSLRYSNTML